MSHHTGRARAVATAIAESYPEKYETWFYFDTRGFRPTFLESIKLEITTGSDDSLLSEESKKILTDVKSSPFCWFEETTTDGKKKMTPIGGRDCLCDWAVKTFDENDTKNDTILSLCKSEPKHSWKELKFDNTTPGTTKSTVE